MKIYSGRMYQTSVRLLIHSTIDVPSGRMYQKWSNVSDFCQTSDTFDYWRCKPSDFWYIRPLTFQVVECIRSYENQWKSMTIHENNRKSDENRMNINERRWKSVKIWWKWSNVSDFRQTSDTFNRVECIRLSSDFWYIRPLTFQEVECIRSDGIGLPSDFWYIRPLTFEWSNVSDLVKISETLWKSIKIIRNLMKIVWTSMKINEYLSKSHENLWKSYENL